MNIKNINLSQIKYDALKYFDNYISCRDDENYMCKCYLMAIRDFCIEKNIDIRDIKVYDVNKNEHF